MRFFTGVAATVPLLLSKQKWIQVTVFKAAFSVVEHRKRLGLVCLHGRDGLVEHGLGLSRGAELALAVALAGGAEPPTYRRRR